MIKVKYKDPYAGGFEVDLPDDTPQEAIQEMVDFLDRNAREIQNADRRERYHTPYSTDALLYEGTDYADADTPETIYLAYEDDEESGGEEDKIDRYFSVLTETQRRRCRMRLAGMTYQQIAAIEEADYSSVVESIKGAQKKLRKKFPDIF